MTALTDIADLAEELCDPRQHTEPIYGWSASRHRIKVRDHITVRPGLLVELRDAIAPLLGGLDEGGARGVPKSTPPVQIDALDRYVDIEVKALGWCKELGIQPRDTLAATVRKLVGAPLGDRARDLRADLRRWRNWSATIAGWEAVFSPDAACPVTGCEKRGTLRINLVRQTAFCTECRCWWDETTIQGLALYLKADEVEHRRVPVRSGTAGNGGWQTTHAPNGAAT